jgi:hypothetical protein
VTPVVPGTPSKEFQLRHYSAILSDHRASKSDLPQVSVKLHYRNLQKSNGGGSILLPSTKVAD